MRITQYGQVTVNDKDVLVEGFAFDGEGSGSLTEGSRLAGEWAIVQIRAVMERCTPGGPLPMPDDSRCLHSRPHEPLHGCNETIGDCKGKCIPVEPERVKGCVRPAYFSHCDYGKASAMCYTCGFWQPLPFPSPGLLQRMGMCVWGAKDWYVVGKARNDGHPIISSRFMTEDEATSLALGWQGIALRWSQGVQG